MGDEEITVSIEGGDPAPTNGELPGATENLIDRVVEDAAGSASTAEVNAEIASAAADGAAGAAGDAAAAAGDAESAAAVAADSLSAVRNLIESIPGAVVEGLRSAAAETVTEVPPQLPAGPEADSAPERTHWLNRKWGRGS